MEAINHTDEIVLGIPSEDKYAYLKDLMVSYIAEEMKLDEETKEKINLAIEITDHTGEIALSIPSEDKYVYLLDLVVSSVAKEMKFDEETTEQVNLAIIEAGTNAMKHGNGNAPGKWASFRFRMESDKLTVFIKDSGTGFNPEDVADPLSPENFMKPCGRGIFLMRALMDEVEYNIEEGSGTEVRLVKYRVPQE